MTPSLYWIEGPWAGRLAVSARPRGGDWLEDEVKGWRASGVDMVVCLLTPGEVDDLGLKEEATRCKEEGISLVSFPIADRRVPRSREEAEKLLSSIAAKDLGAQPCLRLASSCSGEPRSRRH